MFDMLMVSHIPHFNQWFFVEATSDKTKTKVRQSNRLIMHPHVIEDRDRSFKRIGETDSNTPLIVSQKFDSIFS